MKLHPQEESPKPTLYLICGLPGAGKTTFAKKLEHSKQALRLSPDEWIAPLLANTADKAELDRLRTPVEALQWEVALRVLSLGVNVILEWGFWAREERDGYRQKAEALGFHVETLYLKVSLEELSTRLSKRNANLPSGTFAVTQEQINLWSSWFEEPTVNEPVTYIE